MPDKDVLTDRHKLADKTVTLYAGAGANNYTAFCWFNSYKPGDTAEPMMLNSSQASLDKWSSLLSAHQNGVK